MPKCRSTPTSSNFATSCTFIFIIVTQILLLSAGTIRERATTLSQNQMCSKAEWNACKDDRYGSYEAHGRLYCIDVVNGKKGRIAVSCHTNASLPVIDSEETQKAMQDVMQQIGNQFYLLGLTTNTRGLHWDGVNDTFEYENWLPSQVNSTRVVNGTQCAAMDSVTGYWIKTDCRLHFKAICVIDMGNAESVVQASLPTITSVFHQEGKVVYAGTIFKTTCTAQLEFGSTVTHVITYKNTVEGPNSTSISIPIPATNPLVNMTFSYVIANSSCIRVATSILNFPVPRVLGESEDLFNVSCVVHPIHSPALCDGAKVACAVEESILAQFHSQAPSLYIQFHEPPSVAHVGRNLTIECSGCVEEQADMVIYIADENGQGKSDLTDHALLSRSSEDSPCGYFMSITIPLLVDKSLYRRKIGCLVNGSSGGGGEVKKNESQPITIGHGPGRASLRVLFFTPIEGEFEKWEMTVECTACVGSRGNLSWRIMHSDNTSVDLDQMKSLGVRRWQSYEHKVFKCGTRVTSDVNIRVPESLSKSSLLCLPYQGDYPGGERLVASTPLVQTDYLSNKVKTSPKDGISLTEVILLSVLGFFLALILVVVKVALEPDIGDKAKTGNMRAKRTQRNKLKKAKSLPKGKDPERIKDGKKKKRKHRPKQRGPAWGNSRSSKRRLVRRRNLATGDVETNRLRRSDSQKMPRLTYRDERLGSTRPSSQGLSKPFDRRFDRRMSDRRSRSSPYYPPGNRT